MTREEWLIAATDHLRGVFKRAGFSIPENVRVSCGFPSSGARSADSPTMGEHWAPEASADHAHEIFVSPVEADGLVAVAILAHELVHAAVGQDCGHKGPFKKCATAIGLIGPMPSTVAGEDFKAWFNSVADTLGPYPHAALDALKSPRKKQPTRMLKVECRSCNEIDFAPYVIRMSRATLQRGSPICPIHLEAMAEADLPLESDDPLIGLDDEI